MYLYYTSAYVFRCVDVISYCRQRPISRVSHCFQQMREWGVPLILTDYPKSMIEIYLFCQTHAYLDLATLSSGQGFLRLSTLSG